VNLNAFNSTTGCVVANLELTFDILAALKQKVVFYMHHYPPAHCIFLQVSDFLENFFSPL
jgi:hypothetical protein